MKVYRDWIIFRLLEAFRLDQLAKKFTSTQITVRFLPEYMKIIEEADGESDDIEYYGISLMNPYYIKKCRKVWVFGTFVSLERNNTHNLENVTFESAAQIISGKVYMDIIEILYNNDNYLSANQIMDELNWSQAVLYRSLSHMYGEKVIFLKKEKNVHYYSINPEYFKKAEYIVSEKCRSIYHMKNNVKI